MQIYIGNLSSTVSSIDLESLFEDIEERPSFTFRSYQKDRMNFYYALTSIEPETLARELIARNNRKSVKNRNIVLHPYKDRSVFNERRAFGWGKKQWAGEERRKVDRRFAA